MLKRFDLQMSVLKFFDNRVGELGAIRVAEYIRWQREPVIEVSLSHNNVSAAVNAPTAVTRCYACDPCNLRPSLENIFDIWWFPALFLNISVRSF